MHRAAAPLLVLLVTACAPKAAAPVSSEPEEAAPAPEGVPEAGAADVEPTDDVPPDDVTMAPPDPAELHVGVPSCDRYIALYLRCIEEQMPEDSKPAVYEALRESVVSWRKGAETEAGQEGLANACHTATEAVAATCGFEPSAAEGEDGERDD